MLKSLGSSGVADSATGSTTSVFSSRPMTGLSKAASPRCLLRRHHGIELGSSTSRPRSVSEPNSVVAEVGAAAPGADGSGSCAPNR